jgi:chromosome segregation ATPase
MQYMMIIHELLQQQPRTHERLRKSRKLLSTVERYAKELKTSHEAWKKMLAQLRPGSHPTQIDSESLEIALKELEDRLPSDSSTEESDAQVLDAAMLFLRRRTSRG